MAHTTPDPAPSVEPVVEPLTTLVRLPAGTVDLSGLDTRGTAGFEGAKSDAPERTAALQPELAELQERLYAAGRAGLPDAPRVLVVLQGMDTAGKGGVIRHALGMVDPQGVDITGFKAPTAEERRHDFLWRIRRALPGPGMIGIFDRSHYEDVLTVRVNGLAPEEVWQARYDQINDFEAELSDAGVVLVKCFLHVSLQKQRERLLARLDDPAKYWKYNPGDVDERRKWPAYVEAYQAALERCSTQHAPWFVVPADRKWYRNWAVAQLLLEHLRGLGLRWPDADFDVEAERRRVASA